MHLLQSRGYRTITYNQEMQAQSVGPFLLGFVIAMILLTGGSSVEAQFGGTVYPEVPSLGRFTIDGGADHLLDTATGETWHKDCQGNSSADGTGCEGQYVWKASRPISVEAPVGGTPHLVLPSRFIFGDGAKHLVDTSTGDTWQRSCDGQYEGLACEGDYVWVPRAASARS